jgi:hypothetical protein
MPAAPAPAAPAHSSGASYTDKSAGSFDVGGSEAPPSVRSHGVQTAQVQTRGVLLQTADVPHGRVECTDTGAGPSRAASRAPSIAPSTHSAAMQVNSPAPSVETLLRGPVESGVYAHTPTAVRRAAILKGKDPVHSAFVDGRGGHRSHVRLLPCESPAAVRQAAVSPRSTRDDADGSP